MNLKKLSIATAVAAFMAPALIIAAPTSLQNQINKLNKEVKQLKTQHSKHYKFHAVSVTSTPLLARRSAFTGADLTSNFSTINEDLTLLQTRQQDEAAMAKHGGLKKSTKQRPWIQLGGYLNAAYQYNRPDYFGSTTTHTSDLGFTAAELDTSVFVSPWVNAFVALKWASLGATANQIAVNRAFITMGNISKSPIYGSFGNMYVPFGRYSTSMISSPITKTMGRTLSTHGTALLGFYKNNFNGQAYVFQGDVKVAGKQGYTFGADINYKGGYKGATGQFGLGVISNLTESLGMQSFVYTTNTYGFTNVAQRVPGVDVNGEVDYKFLTLKGEFVSAVDTFDKNDLTYNGNAAKPKTMHVEGLYNFTMKNRPSNVGAFFGHSWQALGIALPRTSFGLMANTEVKKDLLVSLQYSHNIDYKASDTSTGPGVNPVGQTKNQNVFYVQLAAYF